MLYLEGLVFSKKEREGGFSLFFSPRNLSRRLHFLRQDRDATWQASSGVQAPSCVAFSKEENSLRGVGSEPVG